MRSAPSHGMGVTTATGTGVSPGAGVPTTLGPRFGWKGLRPVTVQAFAQSRKARFATTLATIVKMPKAAASPARRPRDITHPGRGPAAFTALTLRVRTGCVSSVRFLSMRAAFRPGIITPPEAKAFHEALPPYG